MKSALVIFRQMLAWLVPFAAIVVRVPLAVLCARVAGTDDVTSTLVVDAVLGALLVVVLRSRLRACRMPSVREAAALVAALLATWFFGQAAGLVMGAACGEHAVTAFESGVPMIVLSFFVAPLFEECAYRGLSLDVMHSCGNGVVVSILWCSAMFALSHNTVTHLLPTLALGAFASYVSLRFGLAWSVGVHVAYNLLAAFLPSQVTFSFGMAAPVVAYVGVVACIIVSCMFASRLFVRGYVVSSVFDGRVPSSGEE